MKTIKNFFLACLLFVSVSIIYGSGGHLEFSENHIRYTISFDENRPRLARVAFSCIPKDSILYMTQGASQLPKRWATFVKNIKAEDADGTLLELKELEDARWQLPKSYKGPVSVSYEVHLDHEEHEWSGGLDGVAYKTDWGVFYTGRALLVFHGSAWKNIEVQFELPKGWKVTTPWNPINPQNTAFKVANDAALMQSMLFAGTHKQLSFKRENFELIFAMGGEEVIAEEQQYKNLADGVMDYYIELMGGLPNPAPDNAFDKALVIINNSNQTDGEVIGNNISILVEEGGDPMAKLISSFLFAHEFFHLWNGKSIVPDDQETEWFKEGFTNYYTFKALYRVGVIDENAYFRVLNNLFFQRYHNDDGLGQIAMIQGEEKHAHWGIIYGGGLFVALAQDIMIREASNNRKSIDDLMLRLFKRYGGTHDHYVIDDLEDGLSALTGEDQSDFFSRYIRGKDEVPIAEYLSRAGLKAKIENGQLKIEKDPDATALEKAILNSILGSNP